jgi:hypothetical protein
LKIEIDGETCDCLPQIQQYIQDFYVGLFDVEELKHASLQVDYWDVKYCPSHEDRVQFEAPFTKTELRKIVLILIHLGLLARWVRFSILSTFL